MPMMDTPVNTSFGDQNLRSALRCGSSVKSITWGHSVARQARARRGGGGLVVRASSGGAGTLAIVQRVVASCSPCVRTQAARRRHTAGSL